jgi:hypothetical protein
MLKCQTLILPHLGLKFNKQMIKFFRLLIVILATFFISNISSNLASILSGDYKEDKRLKDIGFTLINENLGLLEYVDNYILFLILANVLILVSRKDIQNFEKIVKVICFSYLQRS